MTRLRRRLDRIEAVLPAAAVIGAAVKDAGGCVIGFTTLHPGELHADLRAWVRREPNPARDFAFLLVLAEGDETLHDTPPLIPAADAHPAVLRLLEGVPVDGALHLKP